jgi:hypothetical protein
LKGNPQTTAAIRMMFESANLIFELKKEKEKGKNPEKRFSFFRNEFRDRHCIETRLCATSLGYGRIWKIKN